jgi:glycosyltransferase involved in cell wall biosynthesis
MIKVIDRRRFNEPNALTKNTICWNMIVRDEAQYIENTIKSALPFITHAAIIDTGSKDNTLQICQETCNNLGLPITIKTSEWKNFEHNRNEALKLAQEMNCDYIMLMDGRTKLFPDTNFKLPDPLEKDCYEILEKYCSLQYLRPFLIRSNLPWIWKGETHEYLDCQRFYTTYPLSGIYRERPGKTPEQYKEKLERDLGLLLGAYRKNPDDCRTIFYLAQTHRDLGNFKEAIDLYTRRMEMGGWDEEAWWSAYQIGCVSEQLDLSEKEIVFSYLRAYNRRPTRAEPIYRLARYYRCHNYHDAAFLFAQQAVNIPIPNDRLFVEKEVYEWRALDELAISAYWVGKYYLSKLICDRILNLSLPENEASRIISNRSFAEGKINA